MPDILIVEDSSTLQKIIQKQLLSALVKFYEISEIKFIFAVSGEEALEKAKNDLYMVIMNGKLTGKMSGSETYIRLCKLYPDLENITIGWSTSYSLLENWNSEIKLKYESDDIPQCEKPINLPLMKYFLTKPAQPAEITDLIKDLERNIQVNLPQAYIPAQV